LDLDLERETREGQIGKEMREDGNRNEIREGQIGKEIREDQIRIEIREDQIRGQIRGYGLVRSHRLGDVISV
jgi:hypothetical protein